MGRRDQPMVLENFLEMVRPGNRLEPEVQQKFETYLSDSDVDIYDELYYDDWYQHWENFSDEVLQGPEKVMTEYGRED